MSLIKLFLLIAVCVAAIAAQGYQAPSYSQPAYQAPSYDNKGRVKIQVYRGPNKDYNKEDSFAPNGYYVQQPEDNKAYGY